jgi:hypothetical protein
MSTIKQMSMEVQQQLSSWWNAPAVPPALPALAAALTAASSSSSSSSTSQQRQQEQHSRQTLLLQVLVAGYFPLHLRDLEEWLDQGEQWAHANSDTASSSEGLKSSSHQLVLSLLLSRKAALSPVLVQLLQGVSALVPPGWGYGSSSSSSSQQQQQQPGVPPLPGPVICGPGGVVYPVLLLLKEAVYEAVALSAYELHDFIDYQGWLRSSLLPEMTSFSNGQHQLECGQLHRQQQLLPLLPRAAARLVGHWVAALKSEDRPAVYAALTMLLVQPPHQQHTHVAAAAAAAAEPDVVLQLAAASALRTLVDDFGFEGAQFLPMLPAVMGALTRMLRDSDELDTQTQVVRGSDNLYTEGQRCCTSPGSMKHAVLLTGILHWQKVYVMRTASV